ncbi:MAG TPA: hypothetical protein DEE98_07565 [Elusimicrobia bacterium]|nr:MAG: hypothetical protein A2278_00405 [Elusimicrobia bacterium RIFOXYA12_FULL_49_49]OGS06621.1 MAG: hypothetical protein A2204_00315 [Elusimicrobia bacterium RIFOXYA1_FULL_47_7]OGS15121.1 MAG: hypothetical protein A2251_00415 [Elusimicrobia bacterium RIFOXYA2_FULL_47_53]OGS29741.1 MAG: hypothetical protein A2323_01215 [Elusimicrobia bacterium RIFOXYB2_FULL_46_23]HBU70220.1 hypothetical protein [Elusimicrobiota bacterium]
MNPSVKGSIIFALALVSLLFAPLRAANDGKAAVKSIKIEGVRSLKISDLKKVMDTKFPNWIPFAQKPDFNSGVLKNDLKNIETYYQANGYFDASAVYTAINGKNESLVRIIIKISEGEASIVDGISLRLSLLSAQDTTLLAALTGLLTVQRGKRFNYKLYETSKKKILLYLNENGYGSATIEGKVQVNKLERSVNILFKIQEGPLQEFGETAVIGNKGIKTEHITDELTFEPGVLYSSAKVSQSSVNIFNLGLFQSASVTAEVSSNSAVVPVNIKVVEGDKRQLRLGIGYAAEAKVRAGAQWSRYYLWGRPRTLTIGASYSAIEENINAKIAQPNFFSRNNDLSVMGAFDREAVVSYTNEKISAQLQVNRNIQRNISIFTAYNLGINRPVDLDGMINTDDISATPGSSYFISSLSAGMNYAFVDNPAYPAHGITYSQYFEQASYLLGSEADYFKGVTECHLYGILISEFIIASRLKFGFISPSRFTADIPIFKRFFSGGSYSVRGYGFQQIGPKDEAGNPLGGRYQIEGNIELRYPIVGKLKGIVFVDSGSIYQTNFSFNESELSYGVGTGVRYVTPIGPIGIDLAFPVLLRQINFDAYNFYLTIGQGF